MALKLFIDKNDVKEVNGHKVKRFYIDPESLPQDHHFLKQLEVTDKGLKCGYIEGRHNLPKKMNEHRAPYVDQDSIIYGEYSIPAHIRITNSTVGNSEIVWNDYFTSHMDDSTLLNSKLINAELTNSTVIDSTINQYMVTNSRIVDSNLTKTRVHDADIKGRTFDSRNMPNGNKSLTGKVHEDTDFDVKMLWANVDDEDLHPQGYGDAHICSVIAKVFLHDNKPTVVFTNSAPRDYRYENGECTRETCTRTDMVNLYDQLDKDDRVKLTKKSAKLLNGLATKQLQTEMRDMCEIMLEPETLQ